MFGFTKRKNSGIQGGSSRLWRAFNYGQESNIRCFVAKSVMLRVTRAMRGGSQKVTNDDEGEGGGHDTPQKWWRHLWTAPNLYFFLTPFTRWQGGKSWRTRSSLLAWSPSLFFTNSVLLQFKHFSDEPFSAIHSVDLQCIIMIMKLSLQLGNMK